MENIVGKDEVSSSNLDSSSKKLLKSLDFGSFCSVFPYKMWVKKWVRQDDPQLDPHGEMSGKVSRAPGRKFGFPARCFWRCWVDFYIIWVIKFPMVSAAWSCICRVAWV